MFSLTRFSVHDRQVSGTVNVSGTTLINFDMEVTGVRCEWIKAETCNQ